MTKTKIESFVCAMYGYPRVKSVDTVRLIRIENMVKGKSDKILKSAKVDLSRIPPCRRSLIPHIRRANYGLSQWKQAHIPFVELPSPTDHGWTFSDNHLEPIWSEGPILPESLMDIIKVSNDEKSQYECNKDDEDSDSDEDTNECDNVDDEEDEDDI